MITEFGANVCVEGTNDRHHRPGESVAKSAKVRALGRRRSEPTYGGSRVHCRATGDRGSGGCGAVAAAAGDRAVS